MQKGFLAILGLALFGLLLIPDSLYAATKAKASLTSPPLEISGWVPYWKKATGTQDAILHISALKEISPFGYTVKDDGTLFDAMKIDEDPWPALIKAAHEQKVKVIPSITWAKADAIDYVLRSPKRRKAHITEIVNMVKAHGFDGVDIDYEGKSSKTKKYFSRFLRDLYQAIGNKIVSCSIEPRTPLDSRFDVIPADVQYANDYTAINKYCDRVRIMTYDQGSIDLKLNAEASDPYIPVADPKWVEKVIRLAARVIPKRKIVLGIPTYGYEYYVTPLSYGYRYKLLGAFNQKYALDIASQIKIMPTRNTAGELSFIYRPTSPVLASQDPTLSNNPVLATSTATQFATTTDITSPFNIVWWSDANAVKDKITLAKKLGVRGVALFKIDGGEDPAIWDVLK